MLHSLETRATATQCYKRCTSASRSETRSWSTRPATSVPRRRCCRVSQTCSTASPLRRRKSVLSHPRSSSLGCARRKVRVKQFLIVSSLEPTECVWEHLFDSVCGAQSTPFFKIFNKLTEILYLQENVLCTVQNNLLPDSCVQAQHSVFMKSVPQTLNVPLSKIS